MKHTKRILSMLLAISLVIGISAVIPLAVNAEEGGEEPIIPTLPSNPHEEEFGAFTEGKGVALPDGAIVWDGTYADAFAGGTGTEDDPFQIANAAQFMYFRDTVVAGGETAGVWYKLTDNIFLNDPDYVNAKYLAEPVGDFAGTFDGNGYGIYNAYTKHGKNGTEYPVALFHSVSGSVGGFDAIGFSFQTHGTGADKSMATVALTLTGTIHDVRVIGFTARQYASGPISIGGVVASANENAQILNCSVSGFLKSVYGGRSKSGVGGIAAKSNGADVTIDSCINYATLHAQGNNCSDTNSDGCAGIIATIFSTRTTVKNCINYGSLVCNGTSAAAIVLGGIAGWDYAGSATVENCINYGNISAETAKPLATGGIFGYHRKAGTPPAINNCTNYGNITAPAAERCNGGIIGGFGNASTNHTLTNIANYGSVSVAAKAGGIVGTVLTSNGNNRTITLTNAVNYGNVTVTGDGAGGFVGAVNKDITAKTTGVVLNNCLSTGQITANSMVGGVFGTAFDNDEGDTGAYMVTLTSVYLGGTVTATAASGLAGIIGGDYSGVGTFTLTNDNVFHDLSVTINDAAQDAPNTYYLASVGSTADAPVKVADAIASSSALAALNTYATENALTPWVAVKNIPTLVTNLGITGASVSLKDTMALTMYLDSAVFTGTPLEGATVKFVRDGAEIDATPNGTKHEVSYADMPAKDMGRSSAYSLKITKDEVTYTCANILTYSLVDYITNLYTRTTAPVSDEVKTVLASMLGYGAAAETAKYGTTVVSDAAIISNIALPTELPENYTNAYVTDADIETINNIASVGAALDSGINLYFAVDSDITSLTVKAVGFEKTYEAVDGIITVTDLHAGAIKNLLVLTFHGATDTSANFSIGSFLERRLANADEETLVKATIIYMMHARDLAIASYN